MVRFHTRFILNSERLFCCFFNYFKYLHLQICIPNEQSPRVVETVSCS